MIIILINLVHIVTNQIKVNLINLVQILINQKNQRIKY